MKDMIEVKTSTNYKMGKSTINSRIGEDYEPDKPIMVYNSPQQNQNPQHNIDTPPINPA